LEKNQGKNFQRAILFFPEGKSDCGETFCLILLQPFSSAKKSNEIETTITTKSKIQILPG